MAAHVAAYRPRIAPAPARRRPRFSFARRQAWLLVAAASVLLTVAYVAVALFVVFRTQIGPIALSVDDAAGRGMHAGDLMAVPVLGCAALCLMFAVECWRHWADWSAQPALVR